MPSPFTASGARFASLNAACSCIWVRKKCERQVTRKADRTDAPIGMPDFRVGRPGVGGHDAEQVAIERGRPFGAQAVADLVEAVEDDHAGLRPHGRERCDADLARDLGIKARDDDVDQRPRLIFAVCISGVQAAEIEVDWERHLVVALPAYREQFGVGLHGGGLAGAIAAEQRVDGGLPAPFRAPIRPTRAANQKARRRPLAAWPAAFRFALRERDSPGFPAAAKTPGPTSRSLNEKRAASASRVDWTATRRHRRRAALAAPRYSKLRRGCIRQTSPSRARRRVAAIRAASGIFRSTSLGTPGLEPARDRLPPNRR